MIEISGSERFKIYCSKKGAEELDKAFKDVLKEEYKDMERRRELKERTIEEKRKLAVIKARGAGFSVIPNWYYK